jgi:hypothetical protein
VVGGSGWVGDGAATDAPDAGCGTQQKPNNTREQTGESSLDKQIDNKFCNDTAHAHATHMDLRCTVVISRARRLCSNRQQTGLVLHGDAGDDGCVVLEVQGVGGGNAPHLHGKNEPDMAASTITHDSNFRGVRDQKELENLKLQSLLPYRRWFVAGGTLMSTIECADTKRVVWHGCPFRRTLTSEALYPRLDPRNCTMRSREHCCTAKTS